MKKILVRCASNSYPVMIGNSFLNELPQMFKKYKTNHNLFFVIDRNVFNHYRLLLEELFSGFSGRKDFHILPAGERTKSDRNLNKIYNSLLKNKFGKDTTLIAIGGGVTGDIAGYAAATYMRGIHLVHVPTTLLAMIDSSIGGKTGINYGDKKNIVGAFYQPKLVFIDTDFLTTLPKREINSACGELIKYGLISNTNFYNYVNKNLERIKSLEDKIVANVISESVSIKTAVVLRDEFETKGVRKILNLGHTFAHAFESKLDFKIKHGEAVTAGIMCALYLSKIKGLIDNEQFMKLLKPLTKLNFPEVIKHIDNDEIFRGMYSDKKNVDNKIMFVLLSEPGKVFIDVPALKKEIFKTLNWFKSN